MFRPFQCLLCGAILSLASCATTVPAGQSSLKNPTVISVAKNGAVRVNHQAVPLKKLASTLKGMGASEKSQFKIEGENGTDPRHIEQVLEVLVDNGLLPKNTID